jgi:hypothetical protein
MIQLCNNKVTVRHGAWFFMVVTVLPLVAVQARAATVRYLSDISWASATSGWGPVEKDRSNGEQPAGDGRTISLAGRTYAKGLGAHAYSDIRFGVGGCTSFNSDVGIDDEARPGGSVVFQVWADGSKLFDSGTLNGNSAARNVNLDVSGKNELALIVTDAGDGTAFDHADWANAQVTCNDAAPANLSSSAPITVDGKQNVTISGVRITNSAGPCITVRNASNVRVQNSELGPCAGGVIVDSSESVVIDSVYIHDTGIIGNGVDVTFSSDVSVTNNRMENIRSGVYVLQSTLVKVDRNSFRNVQGPSPRGQFVQFDKVSGGGNRVTCNAGENVLGSSYAEEAINMYKSNGDPNDPIQIVGNRIKGGGPSLSGGGIMLGDDGGSYILVKENILVNPGQQGISVGSGHDIYILNNLIYSKQQYFSNTGLTVWNQYPSPCYSITVQENSVNFTNSAGRLTPTFSGGGCGSVAGWSNNNWNAAIGEEIWDQPIASCN